MISDYLKYYKILKTIEGKSILIAVIPMNRILQFVKKKNDLQVDSQVRYLKMNNC